MTGLAGHHYPFEKGWWCLGEVWDSLWFCSWKTDPLDGSVYLKLLFFSWVKCLRWLIIYMERMSFNTVPYIERKSCF